MSGLDAAPQEQVRGRLHAGDEAEAGRVERLGGRGGRGHGALCRHAPLGGVRGQEDVLHPADLGQLAGDDFQQTGKL